MSSHKNRMALALGAIGVVFGDIGTSPLYALKECFDAKNGIPLTEGNLLGILSIIVWSLILMVTVKYVWIITRAGNKGEGGGLALTALVQRKTNSPRTTMIAMMAGMIGFSLFYGDSVITPAISILSAVEGLKEISEVFTPYIIPISIGIVLVLFLPQSKGTDKIGKIFAPVMILWFGTIGIIGIYHIVGNPVVLWALNPRYICAFFAENQMTGFLVLGASVLAITGGEALYADMGHFGREAIKMAWIRFVFPCLVLNYFGQGASILANPHSLENPFFLMFPSVLIAPMVILATMATVIASQAVITGTFSAVQQAIQLGYLPRRSIQHTSETERGQIYIPRNNFIMMIVVIILILAFQSSSALAGAYGIAVVGVMSISTVMTAYIALYQWKWSRWWAIPLFGVLLVIDLAFVLANSVKFLEGGWFPVILSMVSFVILFTWWRGRRWLKQILHDASLPIEMFIQRNQDRKRTPGTAVFFNSHETVPCSLLHNMKHNGVLHERVVFLMVDYAEVPRVKPENKVFVMDLGAGFYRVIVRFGFMEMPNIPSVYPLLAQEGLILNPMQTSFFLSRETLVPSNGAVGLPVWQESIFLWLSKTSSSAAEYFGLPLNRVVELGTQVEI